MTIVIRAKRSSVVGPTVSDSMLNCRRLNRPDTCASTPGSWVTSADRTARSGGCSASASGSIRIP